MNLDLLVFVVELESFFLSSHTHTERKGKMKSWEDPVEIGEKRLYTQVMSETCVPISHLRARHGSQGFETSAFLAKIKDGFAVAGRGIQSHGSQETQPQLVSPPGPSSPAARGPPRSAKHEAVLPPCYG